MRRRLSFLAGAALLALLVLALLNWNETAVPRESGLPPPFDDWAALDVPANAAVSIVSSSPVTLSLRSLDRREAMVRATRFESVAYDPMEEYAARAEFTDATDVSGAALALGPGIWTSAAGNVLLFGKPDNARADRARTAWTKEDRIPWMEYEPAAWRGWLLLPDDPPSPLLGLGFIRNREDLLDRTLGTLGVRVDGLDSALRFARMGTVSFGLYGRLGDAAVEIDADLLRGTGTGIIGVGESSYPAFVVAALWGRIASGGGLHAITVDGEEARHRALEGGWHLIAKRYGRTLYLAVGASRTEAEALALAVIENQRARRSG